MSQKIVVITGGSAGIGKATAELFDQKGYVVINLDLKAPEQPIGQHLETDVSSVKAIRRAFDQIEKQYGDIDVLVSNAGVHLSAKIEDTDESTYDFVMDTNLKSAFFVIQSALLLMKGKGGRIITLGSDQTFVGKPNSAVYGITKAAIAQLTKNIALDYGKYGITANCVCPGTIETPFYWNAIKKYCQRSGRDLADVHHEEGTFQPLGRIGQPEEVASLIYYLANDAGRFIQGASIPVDGGYTAQ